MYSESWTRSLGSTIGVSDLVARLPLRWRRLVSGRYHGGYPPYLRLASLQGCEVRLDRVVLAELGLDVVVDRNELLAAGVSNFAQCSSREAHSNLLERVYELAQRLVGPVSNPVPGKAANVLVRRLCAEAVSAVWVCRQVRSTDYH